MRDISLSNVERQQQLARLVEQKSRLSVAQICELFSVSEATARRDLEALAEQGIIRRVHGGAVRAVKMPKEPPMIQRMEEHPREKALIGKAAVKLIRDGETIFLGSGTTVLEVARHLPENIHLTVITNSLPVVNELTSRPEIDLVVIGGMLRKSELSMVGHVAERAINEFRADKAFLGMFAIDLTAGFTNDFPPEVLTDRAIFNIASQVVVLADHSKFARVSSMLIVPITAAQVIITDQDTSQSTIDKLVDMDIQVIRAGARGTKND